MKLITRSILAAAAAAIMLPTWAVAEEAVLRFATTNAPTNHLNVNILHPWAEKVNEEGKGVLKIEVNDSLAFATPVNYFDRVQSDVAQIAWGVQVFLAVKLKLSQVVSVPFLAESSEEASIAFWRLYERGAFGAEYDGLHPIMLTNFPPAGLHLTKEVDNLDSLNGLKVIANGPIGAQWMASLGAAPLSINISESYEALQRNTADGIMMMYTAFQPFKLGEVTKYHIETPLGTAGAWVFMRQDKYDALSPEAKAVLDANTGEEWSQKFGAFWDRVNVTGRKLAEGPEHKFATLTAEQTATWRAKADAVADRWAKATPGGEDVLAAYKAELEKIRAEKKS